VELDALFESPGVQGLRGKLAAIVGCPVRLAGGDEGVQTGDVFSGFLVSVSVRRTASGPGQRSEPKVSGRDVAEPCACQERSERGVDGAGVVVTDEEPILTTNRDS
jgi:hypothetical protein